MTLTKIEVLADELFKMVEYDQGRGFVSDALGIYKTKKEFFDIVRIHLKYSKLAVKQIEKFLNKYGEDK